MIDEVLGAKMIERQNTEYITFQLKLYRISALANLEAGVFSEIRPSPSPAKFLAGFARFGR